MPLNATFSARLRTLSVISLTPGARGRPKSPGGDFLEGEIKLE
jgi:hypothetical protein